MRALLQAAETPLERALVLVLYGCGLRVSEAVGLRWADIDLEGGRALVRGKGSKQRYVGLGQAVTAALVSLQHNTGAGGYGAVCDEATAGPSPAASRRGADSSQRGRLSPALLSSASSTAARAYSNTGPFPYTYRWAEKVIDRLAARAGLGHLTPHQLRHSFADALVGDDMPILQVKDLMGHSSLETTLQYLRARDKQRAVEALKRDNPADRVGA